MPFGRTWMRLGAVCFGAWLTFTVQGVDGAPLECGLKPVEACFRHRGRLSSQNGVALMIWLPGGLLSIPEKFARKGGAK